VANTTGRSHAGRNFAIILAVALLLGSAAYYWFLLGPGKDNGSPKSDKPAAAAQKQPKLQIPGAKLVALEQKLNTPELDTQRLALIPDVRKDLKELVIPADYTLDLKPKVIEGTLEVADIDGVATLKPCLDQNRKTVVCAGNKPKQVTFLFRVIRQDNGSYLVGKAPRK
jgi:hypothetical protein